MKKYIIALDQGTTSSRAIAFDHSGDVVSIAQKEFTQYYPQPGWVEHDPQEIFDSQKQVFEEVAEKVQLSDIGAIGITNQRETAIIWDALTGEPIYNAIVWQDRRTASFCEELKEKGLTDTIREKTGLIIDAYFSATKIRWILDNVPGAREKASRGELRFGTVDSWLLWKFTEGKVHVTDVTNASRTMLFNIKSLQWDNELLDILGIPQSMLPQVRSCSEIYGYTTINGVDIPISGIAGDQQAALFGQLCLQPGSVKNTYGTGCFLLMNTGKEIIKSRNNLLSTIACQIGGKTTYALEGSVFVTGSAVQWLRDGLGVIKESNDVEALAGSVPDNGGVFFVPALTGLGAPYWDPCATGTIIGITRGVTAGHIARATLEGIAFQTMDIVEVMQKDAGIPIESLKVDGGGSRNNLMMQIQSDVLGCEVIRPEVTETTGRGAAYLAGLAVGFWKSTDELSSQWKIDKSFSPKKSKDEVEKLKELWNNAVMRTLTRS